MGVNIGTRDVTRAVSDGTGLTGEELGLILGGLAAATVVIGGLRAAVAFRDIWPKTKPRIGTALRP
jgi:hypothetical protein